MRRHQNWPTILTLLAVLVGAIACGTFSDLQRKRAEDSFTTLSLRYEAAKGLLERNRATFSSTEWEDLVVRTQMAENAAHAAHAALLLWKERGEKPSNFDDEMTTLTDTTAYMEQEAARGND